MDTNGSIHVDGGLRTYNNPYGFDPKNPRGQGYAKVVLNGVRLPSVDLPKNNNTNIEAEAFAILCGICECVKTGKKEIVSDSKFWIDAITKDWKLQEPRLMFVVQMLQSLIRHYEIILTWVPREKNLAT